MERYETPIWYSNGSVVKPVYSDETKEYVEGLGYVPVNYNPATGNVEAAEEEAVKATRGRKG